MIFFYKLKGFQRCKFSLTSSGKYLILRTCKKNIYSVVTKIYSENIYTSTNISQGPWLCVYKHRFKDEEYEGRCLDDKCGYSKITNYRIIFIDISLFIEF